MNSRFHGWKLAAPVVVVLAAWLNTQSLAENSPNEFDEEIEFVGPPQPSLLPRDAMLELPDWKPEDSRELESNQAPTNLGGGLWPSEIWPLMPAPPPLPRPANNLPATRLGDADVTELKPLSPEWTNHYFSSPPDHMVVDPQGLLSDAQQREMAQFLDAYAAKSVGVQVRLLVLANDQKLPDKIAMQEITDRWFPEQRAVVVVYSLGRPKSSLCYFSKSYQAAFPIDKFVGLRDACVKEALIAERSDQQLARYVVKLALRINSLTTPAPSQQTQPTVVLVKNSSGVANWWHASTAGKLSLVLLPAFGLFATGWVWNHRRKLKFMRAAAEQTWLLPDQEMTTRLSAPHCGGTMAVVKFK
jgi:hypothetical protein